MLRFIYIGDQIEEDAKQFAYWDTVRDEFVEYDDNAVFDDWDDFLSCRIGEENKYPQFPLNRFWYITRADIRPVDKPDP